MHKNRKNIALLMLVIVLATVCISLCVSLADKSETCQVGAYINKLSFFDVRETDWYYPDVKYVSDIGLMQGISDTLFDPEAPTTRGMLVTVLWRLNGEPAGNEHTFSDIPDDAYYCNAIAWASKNGIVSGYSENVFAPNDNITREQLAAVLCRYSEYKNYDTSQKAELSKYKDASLISDYAVSAMQWANANEIITGTSEDTIEPQGYALRGQIAAMLHRFCSRIVTADTDAMQKTTSIPSSASGESEEKTHESVADESDQATENVGGISSGAATLDSSQTSDSSAEGITSITVGQISAKSGEDANVDVQISNNPGILGMTLTVHYDEANMTLQSVESGDAVKDVLDFTASKTLVSGAKFLWDGIDVQESDIKDGAVLHMKFKINSNTKPNKYPITIEYAEGDIVDKNLSSISPQIKEGYITVIE